MTHSCDRHRRRGFTLVEVALSMAILSIILLVSVQVLNQTQRAWKRGVTRVEQFREARTAFESITENLRQAILNTYQAYQYNTGDTPTIPTSKTQAPSKYIRQSELQFITGPVATLLPGPQASSLVTHGMFFQARLGLSDRTGYEALSRLLCGRGYFVMYSGNDAFRPKHVTAQSSRFRLWEYRPTAEENTIYSDKPGQWFIKAPANVITTTETIATPADSRPIAENVVALIISPQVTTDDAALKNTTPWWIAPKYAYDSTALVFTSNDNPQGTQHMLPPRVEVTMVAIDEASARKLAEKYPDTMPQLIPDGAFTLCENRQKDLKALEAKMRSEQLNYQVFSNTISMRNSKWGLLR
ncbi:Verru_Chthon cassette protein C [Prosthecobacter sp.]|uniref:Verru_Chthon cassette protein C n=1 Tax=Prosthecobacter sp. TaxID=1965333 RepID=UPI0037834B7E